MPRKEVKMTITPTVDEEALRAQFEEAGFDMVHEDEPGHVVYVHGAPAIHTGLRSAPEHTVNYKDNTVTFFEAEEG